MSDSFDPYLQWLKIPADRRPPTAYDILGIDPSVTDVERIDDLAYEKMAFLRTFQLGKDAEVAQNILNELAMARITLTDPGKRALYDQHLADTEANAADTLPLASVLDQLMDGSFEGPIDAGEGIPSSTSSKSFRPLSRKERLRRNIIRGVLAVVGLIVFYNLFSGIFSSSETDELAPAINESSVTQQKQALTKTARPEPGSAKKPTAMAQAQAASGLLIDKDFEIGLPSGVKISSDLFKIDEKELAVNSQHLSLESGVLSWMNRPFGVGRVVAQHKSGSLHGQLIVLYNGDRPKMIGSFYYDKPSGWLKTWQSDGSRRLFCQYTDGQPNGLGCYFSSDNSLRAVVEYKDGEIVAAHLIDDGRLVESSEGLPSVEAKPELRDAADALESTRMRVERELAQIKKIAQQRGGR
jgi:hypothetical protein